MCVCVPLSSFPLTLCVCVCVYPLSPFPLTPCVCACVCQAPHEGFLRALFRQRLSTDLPAWELVFFEVVRQVFVACEERGVLLERIRHRYSTFRREFERAWQAVEAYAVGVEGESVSACARAAAAEAKAAELTQAVRRGEEETALLIQRLAQVTADRGGPCACGCVFCV